MCRLFGVLAEEPVPVDRWLLDAPIPFVRQANIDPEHLQGEGWGIAWYEAPSDPVAHVVRGPEAVYRPEQLVKFTETARAVRAPVVVAHLRKASNPLHLPRDQLVAMENTQPFLSGPTVFAHNGWIAHPRETMARLGPRASQVKGVNDSEVLQQLFLHLLEEGHAPPAAYARAMTELQEVWVELGRPPRGPYGGLNLLFTPSPTELWAFCHYVGEHGSCLSGLPRPYYEMSYCKERGSVVVTSEPFDRELSRWHPLRSGQYLRARLDGGRLRLEHGSVAHVPAYPLPEGPGPEPEGVLSPLPGS